MEVTKSKIFINRFMVLGHSKVVYNETFHKGVNFIRGEHSVGKSTLLDLLFYCLGGELKTDEWKYPAGACVAVAAEIVVSGRNFCLHRKINPGHFPEISVQEGLLETTLGDLSSWTSYGPRRTENRKSFSELFFQILGWDNQRTQDFANLTMHQVLRLMYFSQSSDANKILRKEPQMQDTENMRLAIGEYLLGLDDLQTHELRQELMLKERDRDSATSELSVFESILGDVAAISFSEISQEIQNLEKKKKALHEERDNILFTKDAVKDLSEQQRTLQDIESDIQESLTIASHNRRRISDLSVEIEDCELFSDSLESRKKSAIQSIETRRSLGAVTFDYCPVCFTPISKNNDPSLCHLCGNPGEPGNIDERFVEMVNEIDFHIIQNNTILKRLKDELTLLTAKCLEEDTKVSKLKERLDSLIVESSQREITISNFSQKIAEVSSQIDRLTERAITAKKIDQVRASRKLLQDRIDTLRELIAGRDETAKERRSKTLTTVCDLAKKYLQMDTGNELSFQTASHQDAEIDFAKDRWLIDGRINFSDSSNVVKKTALHLALLKTAIGDPLCRLPNFAIMDFECNDIDATRSQNLQKIIVNAFIETDDFQLLVATSKINPLYDGKYGVGPNYKKNEYILQL